MAGPEQIDICKSTGVVEIRVIILIHRSIYYISVGVKKRTKKKKKLQPQPPDLRMARIGSREYLGRIPK